MKIRLIWDDCTPTMSRRPTTAEDIENDIHVKEFDNEEEFLQTVFDIMDYGEYDEDEIADEKGETVFDKINSLMRYFSDPGDGSANFLYYSVDGKVYDNAEPYDSMSTLDLENCTEDEVKAAIMSEYDFDDYDDDDDYYDDEDDEVDENYQCYDETEVNETYHFFDDKVNEGWFDGEPTNHTYKSYSVYIDEARSNNDKELLETLKTEIENDKSLNESEKTSLLSKLDIKEELKEDINDLPGSTEYNLASYYLDGNDSDVELSDWIKKALTDDFGKEPVSFDYDIEEDDYESIAYVKNIIWESLNESTLNEHLPREIANVLPKIDKKSKDLKLQMDQLFHRVSEVTNESFNEGLDNGDGNELVDTVYLFKDKNGNYTGTSDVVEITPSKTLKELVESIKAEAEDYDMTLHSGVEFEEEIDYDETNPNDLGTITIRWLPVDDVMDEDLNESNNEPTLNQLIKDSYNACLQKRLENEYPSVDDVWQDLENNYYNYKEVVDLFKLDTPTEGRKLYNTIETALSKLKVPFYTYGENDELVLAENLNESSSEPNGKFYDDSLNKEIELVNTTLKDLTPLTKEYEAKCWELYDKTRFKINDLLNWNSINVNDNDFLNTYSNNVRDKGVDETAKIPCVVIGWDVNGIPKESHGSNSIEEAEELCKKLNKERTEEKDIEYYTVEPNNGEWVDIVDNTDSINFHN